MPLRPALHLSRTLCATASMFLLAGTAMAQSHDGDHGNGGPHYGPQAHTPSSAARPAPAAIGAAHEDHRHGPRTAPAAYEEPAATPHEEHTEVRDHNNHRHAPELVIHAGSRGPRYIPEPIAYYHERGPRYYTSYYYSHRYIPIEVAAPYVEVRCGPQPILGTVVGGVAGGLVGNQFGHGGGRFASTIGGALLGSIIGHSIDLADESCAYQALEYAQANTQVAWADPETNYAYTITPGPITQVGPGRYCREYQAKILIGSRLEDGYGQACRQPDGSWQIVN